MTDTNADYEGSSAAQHCQAQLASLRALTRELDEADWAKPSLCTGWTVKDVIAHLLGGRRISLPQMVVGVARYRGMDPWADVVSRRLAAETPTAQLIEEFDRETRRWPEKGIAGLESNNAKLADNVVHEIDIRRAIDRPQPIPADRMRAALSAATRTNMWGNKKRIKGLRLEAHDISWNHGEGPEVSGPAEDLFLAMNGRPAGLEALSGPGTDTLRSRIG